MTILSSRLRLGDVVEHSQFGRGTVLSESTSGSSPDSFLYKGQFEEGTKYFHFPKKTNILTVNGVAKDHWLRPKSAYASFIGNEECFSAPFDEGEYPADIKQLDEFALKFGYVSFGCNPSSEDEAKSRLRLLGIDPTHSLRVGRSKDRNEKESHGLWMNLFIPDPRMPGVDLRLRVYFNPRALRQGMYQLSRIAYIERLLIRGVRILDIGEVAA